VRRKNRIACPRTASADRQLGEVDRHPLRLVLAERLVDRATEILRRKIGSIPARS
jgi:hypothetical protein